MWHLFQAIIILEVEYFRKSKNYSYEMKLDSQLMHPHGMLRSGLKNNWPFHLDLHQSRLQKLSEEFKKEQEIIKQEFDKERYGTDFSRKWRESGRVLPT